MPMRVLLAALSKKGSNVAAQAPHHRILLALVAARLAVRFLLATFRLANAHRLPPNEFGTEVGRGFELADALLSIEQLLPNGSGLRLHVRQC